MNGVFLDAVGLIALWNRRDQWHEAAGSAFAGIASGESLVTTSYIIGECGNAFSRSEIRTLLIDLTERLDADGTLIFPSDADWHEAWMAFRSAPPGSAGLIDQLSFAVMRRLGLRCAFTNDRHFADAGFETMF